MTTLIRQIIFIIFGFLTISCLAQDSLVNTFQLKSNNKIKTLNSKNEITIDSKWRWNIDSTQIDIEAQWDTAFYVLKDTLVVRPSRIYHQKFIYKANPIRNVTDYNPNSTYVIKLPISDIDKIKEKREYITWPTSIIGYGALTSALIVAPIISIGKEFNTTRFKKVAGYSLITMASALTINLAFGTKIYHVKKHKHRETWTLK